jgi:hypothetical protein
MSRAGTVFVTRLVGLAASFVAISTGAPGFAQTFLAQTSGGPNAAAQAPVPYASVNELNGIIGPLQQTAQNALADLGKMRIEKWKTNPSTKQETLGNIESIQRNLQNALPEIITKVNASPENLETSFQLYRNLDALYDVFESVVESAGAFGTKEEFQSLSTDMTGIETARRSFGERLQKLTASKEAELTNLRAQVKTLSAAPPPPPKKVVVDDTEADKKPVTKKKTTPAKPKPATTNPPAANPPPPGNTP